MKLLHHLKSYFSFRFASEGTESCSPAPQSLLKCLTLQLSDFNVFALSVSEPLVSVTTSATLSEPPPTFVLWCLLTCDAFRISLSCPSCIKACWNMRRMCWTSCSTMYSFPKSLLQKKNPKKPLHQHLLWLESLQHSPSTGHMLRAGTWVKAQWGFVRFSKENSSLQCGCTDTSRAHFPACSAGTHKV